MTQEAFGAAGGVLKRAVAHYEKGERMPDAAFLAGISTAGADVQYIITGQRSQQAKLEHLITAHGIALAHTVRALDPDLSARFAQELLLLSANIRAGGGIPIAEALTGMADGAALYSHNVPAPRPRKTGGNTVNIGGKVEQTVAGDATFSAPVNFGKRK